VYSFKLKDETNHQKPHQMTAA